MLSEEETREIQKAVEASVKKVVNGKIDKLTKRFDDHEQEFLAHQENMQPFLDALKGAIVWRKVFLWISSMIIGAVSTFIAIKGLFR